MRAKCVAVVIGVLGLTPTIVSAQPRAEGYALAAGGGWMNTFNGGGGLFGGAVGLEVFVAPRVGIGAELGALTDLNGGLMAPLSVDGRAHFLDGRRVKSLSPFVLAGYSRLFSFERSSNAPHFGAGVDYRLSDDRALRVEFRDIVQSRRFFTEHYWTVRVGVTNR